MLPLMSFKILIGKRPKSLIFSSEGPACEAPAGLPQFVLPIYSLKLGTSGLSHVLFLFLGTHFLFLLYFIPTHPSQVTLLSRPGPDTRSGSPYFLLSP